MYLLVIVKMMDERPNRCHNSSFLSCLIGVFNHSWSLLYPRPVDCIDAKCLTECQSQLAMVSISIGVSFWFISLVMMCLMDFRSYNKLWAVAGVLGLKSALNPVDSGIGILEIVTRHRHVGLWEYLEVSGWWHSHSLGAPKGLIGKKLSRTQGLVSRKVGMVLRSPIVDVEGLYGVFLSVPLP